MFNRTTLAVLTALVIMTPAFAAPAPTLPAAASPSVPAHIGVPITPPAATPALSAKKIDINSASEADLATLPGIGKVTAKAIVDGRPWDDLNALTAKKVMPQAVFDRNKDRFALANINTSSAADLAKTLPGIGDATAPKIVNGRPYATPQDLVAKKVLTAGQFAKIRDLVAY